MRTFKILCASLADSERFLRCNKTGTDANLRSVIRGRAGDLDEMRRNYPDNYRAYIQALDDRLSKPYDFQTVLDSIPKE